MKKIIAIVLSILTVFSFVSCADNKLDPPETTGNGPEVTTEPETTEAPVGEYVLRHKYADIDEVLDRPEIEVDRSRLKDFYMLVEDYESFRSIDNLTEMAISVKGYGEDRTELILKQQSSIGHDDEIQMSSSAILVIILDNVNKTFGVYRANSMGGMFEELLENTDTADTSGTLEDEFVGGILDLFGSVFNGEYTDISYMYTYETAKSDIDNYLGMYTGIGFFEFMKNNYPDVKFTKRPDEGNCFVYKAQIDDNEVRFKFDRESGLFDHASFRHDEHIEVLEYSFTECLHTDADIPDIAK